MKTTTMTNQLTMARCNRCGFIFNSDRLPMPRTRYIEILCSKCSLVSQKSNKAPLHIKCKSEDICWYNGEMELNILTGHYGYFVGKYFMPVLTLYIYQIFHERFELINK